MFRRAGMLRPLALALVLAAPSMVGCSKDKGLVEIQAPAEGVTLEYSLKTGDVLRGRVNQSESVRDGGSSSGMNRGLSFNVQMTVVGVDEKGNAQIDARISGLDVRWSLPPDFPISLGEFVRDASGKAQGAAYYFVVSKDGKVVEEPKLPNDIEPELSIVLNMVIDGLEAGFLATPGKNIKSGEVWKDKQEKGRRGKLGRFSETETENQFVGMFRVEKDGREVVKLLSESRSTEVTTTQDGGHEVRGTSKTTALFDAKGGYVASIEGTSSRFDGPTTTTRKLSVEWTRAGGGAATEPVIVAPTDPCSPDYVGTEVCPDGTEAVEAPVDPCSPDYVGTEECPTDAAGDGGEPTTPPASGG